MTQEVGEREGGGERRREEVMQGLRSHSKELEHYSKKLQILQHKSIMALLMFSKYYLGCYAEKKVKAKRPQQLS